MLSSINLAALQKDPSLPARLIAVCDSRSQLCLLQPWLEAREAEGMPEGSQVASAVRDALVRLEPPKAKGVWGSLMG